MNHAKNRESRYCSEDKCVFDGDKKYLIIKEQSYVVVHEHECRPFKHIEGRKSEYHGQ